MQAIRLVGLTSNSRTNYYNDFLVAGEEIERIKDLLALPSLH